MELTFLGRGSAFNSKEGNNAAFFVENNELFLIDCGESVFETLQTSGILDNVSNIYLLITHTHSDHVGSLGTLGTYSYFVKNKPMNIITGRETRKRQISDDLVEIVRIFGMTSDMVNFVDEKEFDNRYESFQKIRYVPTRHVKVLDSFGIEFYTQNGIVYYSGDTNEIAPIQVLLQSGKQIDKIYVDCTTEDYPDNIHLHLNVLEENVPPSLRNMFYCMHINNDDCIRQAKSLGFQVVTTIRQPAFGTFENHLIEKKSMMQGNKDIYKS